jgi:demethylmenaquinone methyltransferase/2-methoxy-6-polyprenyl-1,4-benzoquinol methylase
MSLSPQNRTNDAWDENVRKVQDAYWESDQSLRRDPDHPAVAALFEPRAKFLAALIEGSSDGSVLDVGCGNGFLSAPLERRFGTTVALDLASAMIARNPCRRRVRASSLALPFADTSFDLVVCSHLLHHLSDSDRASAVTEMSRVARRAVVLYEPNRNNPLMFAFGLAVREERMSLRFSRRYVASLLVAAGLTRCSSRVEGTVLPNKTPQSLVPLASFLGQTPLRALGFYVRALGWKSHDGT